MAGRVVHGICELCGAEFTKQGRGDPYRFCSRACGVRGRSGHTKKSDRSAVCPVCGKVFGVRTSEAHKRHYCSISCRSAGNDQSGSNNNNYKNAGIKLCLSCGKEFHSYNKTRKYCGPECSWKHSPALAVQGLKKGYAAEAMCADELTSRGYLVMMSKNSRGPFDVIAIGNGGVICIQVKCTCEYSRRRHSREVARIRSMGSPITKFHRKMLWCYVEGRGWSISEMNADGTTTMHDGLDWLNLAARPDERMFA